VYQVAYRDVVVDDQDMGFHGLSLGVVCVILQPNR
jgi:hypothetical protein